MGKVLFMNELKNLTNVVIEKLGKAVQKENCYQDFSFYFINYSIFYCTSYRYITHRGLHQYLCGKRNPFAFSIALLRLLLYKYTNGRVQIKLYNTDLNPPLSKISTRIKGYSSCNMISWPFKRDKGLPSGTVLLQSSLTRKSIPDRRNPLEYYMKPFKQSYFLCY
jgi:hypothetical protein